MHLKSAFTFFTTGLGIYRKRVCWKHARVLDLRVTYKYKTVHRPLVIYLCIYFNLNLNLCASSLYPSFKKMLMISSVFSIIHSCKVSHVHLTGMSWRKTDELWQNKTIEYRYIGVKDNPIQKQKQARCLDPFHQNVLKCSACMIKTLQCICVQIQSLAS